MIHDCKYALEIGAEPVWLGSVGSQVCSLCHTPKKTRTVEVPVDEPPVKAAPKTAGK